MTTLPPSGVIASPEGAWQSTPFLPAIASRAARMERQRNPGMACAPAPDYGLWPSSGLRVLVRLKAIALPAPRSPFIPPRYLLNSTLIHYGLVQQWDKVAAARDLSLFVMFFFSSAVDFGCHA